MVRYRNAIIYKEIKHHDLAIVIPDYACLRKILLEDNIASEACVHFFWAGSVSRGLGLWRLALFSKEILKKDCWPSLYHSRPDSREIVSFMGENYDFMGNWSTCNPCIPTLNNP
jgi:hypothetical protein